MVIQQAPKTPQKPSLKTEWFVAECFRLFLEFLDCLGRDPEAKILASAAYVAPLDTATEDRILRVCRYVHEHFMQPIKLETAAELAGLHPTSFCRFFRKSTGQTFFEYINDLRVAKACNLLLSTSGLSISEMSAD